MISVAIIGYEVDTPELLTAAFEEQGISATFAVLDDLESADGGPSGWVEGHRPKVVVFDIGWPPERSLEVLEAVRQRCAPQGCKFVLTTTNLKRLESYDHPEGVVEHVGKPFDVRFVTRKVREAMEA